MQLIEQAINEYHTKTCIRFVPRMGEKNYVSFESSSSGCWSSVGMIGGKQAVNLQIPGCTTLVGTAIHEMMHALGFLHEQNREDRDDWVRIRYENIKAGTSNNFEKAKKGTTNSFGVAYDYASIMHYSSNAFSTNGNPTIEAKVSTVHHRFTQFGINLNLNSTSFGSDRYSHPFNLTLHFPISTHRNHSLVTWANGSGSVRAILPRLISCTGASKAQNGHGPSNTHPQHTHFELTFIRPLFLRIGQLE